MQYLEPSCVRCFSVCKGRDIGRRATVVKGADFAVSKARVQLDLCWTQQGERRVGLVLRTNIDEDKEEVTKDPEEVKKMEQID